MTYLTHLRITATGNLPGGEVWSCSLAMTPPNVDPSTYQDVVNRVAGIAGPLWAAAAIRTDTRFSSGVSVLQTIVRMIGPDGKTIVQGLNGSAGQGNGVSISMPNQCAVVASLLTGVPGARGRGRLYLPSLGVLVGTTGRIQPGTVGPLAASVQTLLNGLNTQVGAEFDTDFTYVCVASGVGTGTNARVTTVRVGDVIDTQRRRRDAIPETYSALAVTPPAG